VTAALTAAVVLAVRPAAGGARVPRCSAPHWVGSWGAAPGHVTPPMADATLRVVAAPHHGGRRLRVRLSNRFGAEPLSLHAVVVGRRAAGAGVVAGTQRAVHFRGRRAVTLAPGADVVSDPVRLRFRPFGELAVSLFTRDATPAVTTNDTMGTETGSYVAAGNHALDAAGAAFSAPTTAIPLLTRIDVLAPRRIRAIAALGDSITHGFDSIVAQRPGERHTRWPDFLARRLRAAGEPAPVVNAGIGGNRILRDGVLGRTAGPRALARIGKDVLAVPGVTAAVVLLGINDINGSPPATAGETIAGLRQVVARLRRAGLRVLLGTLLPDAGNIFSPFGGSPAGDAVRQAVNAWIRAGGGAHAVVDFDAAVRDPADPARLLPRYDGGDHIHPNARGYERMAGAVDLRRLGRARCRS
jgi:lysophospholipase L1-like esterase